MSRLVAWWESLAGRLWLAVDLTLYRWHRRRCTDCQTGHIERCHCGAAAVVEHQQMCVRCADQVHETCWCSVRPELADDINDDQ